MEKGFQGSASHGNNKRKGLRCHIWETVTSVTQLDDRLLETGKEPNNKDMASFSFYD